MLTLVFGQYVSVISRLMGEFSGLFGFSCSYTTRHPRPGEREGIEYHFVTAGDMHEAIERVSFAPSACIILFFFFLLKKLLTTF